MSRQAEGALDKYFHSPEEEPMETKELLMYDAYGWFISSYYFPIDGDWKDYALRQDIRGWIYLKDITNSITQLKNEDSRN